MSTPEKSHDRYRPCITLLLTLIPCRENAIQDKYFAYSLCPGVPLIALFVEDAHVQTYVREGGWGKLVQLCVGCCFDRTKIRAEKKLEKNVFFMHITFFNSWDFIAPQGRCFLEH